MNLVIGLFHRLFLVLIYIFSYWFYKCSKTALQMASCLKILENKKEIQIKQLKRELLESEHTPNSRGYLTSLDNEVHGR